MNTTCEWRWKDDREYYETSCGDTWGFTEGSGLLATGIVGGIEFCPYCGCKITASADGWAQHLKLGKMTAGFFDEMYNEQRRKFFSKVELVALFNAWVDGRNLDLDDDDDFDEAECELFNKYMHRMRIYRLHEGLLHIVLMGESVVVGFNVHDEVDFCLRDNHSA